MKPIRTLATAAAFGATTMTASADTFVLVHGAFQSAAGWTTVADDLTAKGHTVVAVDLPGRGAMGAEAQAVTLADYIATVRVAVERAGEPVILVGHSFGGITISAVAEEIPQGIKRLVYVAAYVPQNDESMQALAEMDKDNGFTAESFVLSADYSYATILETDQVRLFGADASPEQQAALPATMLAEPLGPIATPVTLTDAFGSVDKSYVMTLQDATISPQMQRMMIDRAGIASVTEIDSGHLPYLTRPDALATMLDGLAG
jgi:pimeloyl-ACP methyl ester carboxylesterase